METYSYFETKRLSMSYTDLKRITATSVFVTKVLNKSFYKSDKNGNKRFSIKNP